LKIRLGHINAAIIAFLQIVSEFLNKSFNATAAVSSVLQAKIQGNFPQ